MQKPSFKEAFKFWIKLGFISFGGPAGQIAIMHEFLVDKKKWISDSRFLHALNYCMILPGPEAQQLATYIGWLLHGFWGGIAAGVMFVLPSMFILIGFSALYVTFGNIPWIYAMFTGLKPAVIAIVILALIKIGKKSLVSYYHYIIAAIAFLCIFFFNIPFPLIILGVLVLATVLRQWFPALFAGKDGKTAEKEADETGYVINRHAVVHGSFSWANFARQFLAGIVLWCIPFLLLYLFAPDFAFWQNLSIFFTKAALVTFGGAYAVLPYVAQVSVEKFNWLSKYQMIDGLALGETTPGPLIMVLAFVGFMAGHNHFSNSVWFGTLGLVLTTYYTFLPCFLFIFAGAPVIERTRGNSSIKQILSYVTAAVVGVVLNLTIYLAVAVIFPAGISIAQMDSVMLAWIIISFFAMYRFKIGMIPWVGISALFGLVYYFVLNA